VRHGHHARARAALAAPRLVARVAHAAALPPAVPELPAVGAAAVARGAEEPGRARLAGGPVVPPLVALAHRRLPSHARTRAKAHPVVHMTTDHKAAGRYVGGGWVAGTHTRTSIRNAPGWPRPRSTRPGHCRARGTPARRRSPCSRGRTRTRGPPHTRRARSSRRSTPRVRHATPRTRFTLNACLLMALLPS
jgi:hypothetical protein